MVVRTSSYLRSAAAQRAYFLKEHSKKQLHSHYPVFDVAKRWKTTLQFPLCFQKQTTAMKIRNRMKLREYKQEALDETIRRSRDVMKLALQKINRTALVASPFINHGSIYSGLSYLIWKHVELQKPIDFLAEELHSFLTSTRFLLYITDYKSAILLFSSAVQASLRPDIYKDLAWNDIVTHLSQMIVSHREAVLTPTPSVRIDKASYILLVNTIWSFPSDIVCLDLLDLGLRIREKKLKDIESFVRGRTMIDTLPILTDQNKKFYRLGRAYTKLLLAPQFVFPSSEFCKKYSQILTKYSQEIESQYSLTNQALVITKCDIVCDDIPFSFTDVFRSRRRIPFHGIHIKPIMLIHQRLKRFHDAEAIACETLLRSLYKSLLYHLSCLQEQKKNYKERLKITGTITFFSQREPCLTCIHIYRQFDRFIRKWFGEDIVIEIGFGKYE